MTERKIEVTSNTSDQERAFEREFARCFAERPIPDDQILQNLGLFLSSKNLSRILFMHHLYQQTISVPGIVMDFGTRWGQNLALFAAYRGMYDPFHRHRKLVGFDTFAGFPGFAPQDGTGALIDIGSRSVPENYVEYLTRVMECQEGVNPLAHIRKFELVEGNACLTLPKYLEDNPETIVALAYFDFDLYEPTKVCLEAIRPRLVKGSVLGFDELNDHGAPGETLALMETFGLGNVSLRRYPYASRATYFVVE